MSEKQIKGIVEKFSKIEVGTKNDEANTPFAYVDLFVLDNQYPNRFFFNSPEEIKEKLIDKIPIGSTVEFKIFKKDKFWNVDKKSFNLVYEGDGNIPKSQSKIKGTAIIIRQNALRHADEWVKILASYGEIEDLDKFVDSYFEFAEKCEEWITRE